MKDAPVLEHGLLLRHLEGLAGLADADVARERPEVGGGGVAHGRGHGRALRQRRQRPQQAPRRHHQRPVRAGIQEVRHACDDVARQAADGAAPRAPQLAHGRVVSRVTLVNVVVVGIAVGIRHIMDLFADVDSGAASAAAAAAAAAGGKGEHDIVLAALVVLLQRRRPAVCELFVDPRVQQHARHAQHVPVARGAGRGVPVYYCLRCCRRGRGRGRGRRLTLA